jgi:prevent-host-death family protein
LKATAKDLRFNSKELLESVRRGEEIIITFRGKPCAKLIPISESPKNKQRENALFGIWQDYDFTKDVNDYVRSLRRGRFQ